MTKTPYFNYVRHRLFPRLRHSRHGLGPFLSGEATALTASATGQTVAPKRATNTVAEATVVFASNPANNDTLTIGTVTYTFKTALSTGPAVPNEIFIGALATNTRDNVVAAITAGAGAGTTYGTGTVAHPLVTAAAATNDLLVQALTSDIKGNAVPLAKSSTHLTIAQATLDGPMWTATGHAFVDGEGPVFITNAGGALPTNTLTGELWVHVIDANTVAFGSSRGAVRKYDFMPTSSAGTGTQTAKRAATAAAMLDVLKQGNKARTVAAATDIDNLK